MPLRRKFLLSMVIPALLLGMLGAIGIFSLRHIEQAAGRILAANYRSIQEARRMTRSLPLLEVPVDDGAGAASDDTRAVAKHFPPETTDVVISTAGNDDEYRQYDRDRDAELLKLSPKGVGFNPPRGGQ